MAFIRFSVPYHNHLGIVVSAAKALEIENFLNNPPDDLTDDQSDFLLAIHKIYHGKGNRAAVEAENTSDEHLTHTGIAQGMSSAVPTGDR